MTAMGVNYWPNACILTCGMGLSRETEQILEQFLHESGFFSTGGVITDLDGTALHEVRGRELPPNRSGNRRHASLKPNSAGYP